jgi:hypothetical protein
LVVPGISTWQASINEYGYSLVQLTYQLLIPHHYAPMQQMFQNTHKDQKSNADNTQVSFTKQEAQSVTFYNTMIMVGIAIRCKN